VRQREQCVPRPAAPCRDSQFSSARVRRYLAEVRRVRRFVPVNAVLCIRRARLRLGLVRSALAPGCRLQDPFAPAVVPVPHRVGPDNATFRVA